MRDNNEKYNICIKNETYIYIYISGEESIKNFRSMYQEWR